MKPKAASGPWNLGWMRSFMVFYRFQWLERGGRMRWDSTGVNGRIRKGERKLKGEDAEGESEN